MRKLSNTKAQRGQSMIETALLFPILLMLFAGMIEEVFISRSYLAILDASYQGAHLGSQGMLFYDNNQIYTLVQQDLSPKYNTSSLIDVIITRATLNGGTSLTIDAGYPKNMKGSSRHSIFANSSDLSDRLRSNDLGGRLIVVEVVYDHPLLFDFPIIWDLLPNPFPLVAYTIQYVAR